MNRHPRINRRNFGITAAAVAVPTIVSPTAVGRTVAPSDRLSIGVVGLGARAFQLLGGIKNHQDIRITAICDVDSNHYRDRPWGTGMAYGREPIRQVIDKHYQTKPGRGVFVTADYRELCAREDIDAVVVATPDHWHALCTLEAIKAGKDVYCEKPVTHTFAEGKQVVAAVAESKTIFQTGSQQRSDWNFRRAVELVRNGLLGKLQRIEIGLPPGYDEPQGDTTISDPPDHLDYEFWTGPAPMLPYMRARHHRWWRGHRAYGGGVLMDWIGHHNDIAHWAMGMDQSGPTKVEATGWVGASTKVYDTPAQYEIQCEYPGGIQTSIASRHTLGARFIGTKGQIFVTRGKLQTSNPRWSQKDFDPGSVKVTASDDHLRNFIDGVKHRTECIAPAETAHRSISPGHLGYVSNALGRPLQWDAKAEKVVDDDEANRLLMDNKYRKQWG